MVECISEKISMPLITMGNVFQKIPFVKQEIKVYGFVKKNRVTAQNHCHPMSVTPIPSKNGPEIGSQRLFFHFNPFPYLM